MFNLFVAEVGLCCMLFTVKVEFLAFRGVENPDDIIVRSFDEIAGYLIDFAASLACLSLDYLYSSMDCKRSYSIVKRVDVSS